MKFVRIVKNWKTRTYNHEDTYDGVLIKHDKDGIEFIGVGPNKDSRVKSHYFNKKEEGTTYKISKADSEQVEHFFKLSILSTSNELNDAYFALLDKKRNHISAKGHFKKFFRKELVFENIDLDGV